MKIYKKVIPLILVSLTSLSANSSNKNSSLSNFLKEVSITPSIAYGYGEFKYDYHITDTTLSGGFIDYGINFGYEDYFIYVSGQQMLKEDSYSGYDALDKVNIYKGDGDRNQYSITLGYFLKSNLGLFVGYRDTKVENSERYLYQEDKIFQQNGKDFKFENAEIKEYGFFAGASYGWYIESLEGAINAKVGLAYQDWNANIPFGVITKYSSNGLGANLGVGWSSMFSENSNYFINIDSYYYKYDKVTNAEVVGQTELVNLGKGFEPTSSMLSIKFGFNYFF